MTPAREFQVGALSFRLDLATGWARALRWHGQESVRAVYPAVRDANWDTLAPRVELHVVRATTESVEVRMEGDLGPSGRELTWTARVTATTDRFDYTWHARVGRAFTTNRAGLCVLHPAELAGAPCTVEHTDGRRVAAWFPSRVAPHQPFTELRGLTHPAGPRGGEVSVRCEGETFEMEDQRNWTDASFKTYCRPLRLPFPYTLETGQEVRQRVALAWRGRPAPSPADEDEPFSLPAELAVVPRPRIGFTLPGPLPAGLAERLRLLQPDHLRVDSTGADLRRVLEWAVPDAAAVGTGLHLAVHGATPPPSDLARDQVTAVHLYDSAGHAVADEVVRAWRDAGFVHVGTGSARNFTELNRFRPAFTGGHDHVCCALQAQVHAVDDDSLAESLTQHRTLMQTAWELGGDRPVAVGPIVLGKRDDAPEPRLFTALGAAWTLGCVVELAAAPVATLTFFRTHGPGAGFSAAVSPLEELFRLLARATSVRATSLRAADGVHLRVLVLETPAGRHLLLAHDARTPRRVRLPSGWSLDAPVADPAGLEVAPETIRSLAISR